MLKAVADIIVGADSQAKAGMTAGAVLFVVGTVDENPQRARWIRAAGVALAGFYFFREQRRAGGFLDALEGAAALPAGNDGISGLEKALGLAGRAVGLEPDPGIEDRAERGAEDRFYLGTPKNVLRVAGAWRQPVDGGEVPFALFSNTFEAHAVLENQNTVAVPGQVRARLAARGLLESETQHHLTDGPSVRLEPGESRALSMRLEIPRDFDGELELALLFANYNLATVRFSRRFVAY